MDRRTFFQAAAAGVGATTLVAEGKSLPWPYPLVLDTFEIRRGYHRLGDMVTMVFTTDRPVVVKVWPLGWRHPIEAVTPANKGLVHILDSHSQGMLTKAQKSKWLTSVWVSVGMAALEIQDHGSVTHTSVLTFGDSYSRKWTPADKARVEAVFGAVPRDARDFAKRLHRKPEARVTYATDVEYMMGVALGQPSDPEENGMGVYHG